ncbi:hypothetical protein AJ80_02460 [Polytolypa hystricis UAMH7299]|uniref:Bms1-type G domain-containing protein n=1 Tax=Polytolypa hystricis (strain UAMH7299) TaxID=1447883 RepID=A0A2B7YPC5_POLH7|nr:hypothetical protein AJ80_02460 [Polytolypa hystricis UAMH7299]
MAPAAVATPHHHRSTTKQSHKSFKSKHMSKGALKEIAKGKVETSERGVRKTPHQQLMSKLDRRNQARQKQRVKHQGKSEALSIFNGHHGAARHVAVIPLAESVDVQSAIRLLGQSVEIAESDIQDGIHRVRIDRFKQSVMYIPTQMDLISALDACRLADFVVFVLPPTEDLGEDAQHLLRSVEGQGISNVLAVVQNLESVTPLKRRQQLNTSLKIFMTHFFPAVDKVHSLDSRQECANIMRGLCTATPKGIRWREDRSWMLLEDVQWPDLPSDQSGEVVVTGVVRGRGLNADRLVHIPGWGDHQISSIVAAPLPKSRLRKGDAMNVDETTEEEVLDEPTAERDDLDTISPEEVMMTDDVVSMAGTERKGVLLDDYHYFSEEELEEYKPPKRMPKGTSKYQSAWYLDNASDSGSDMVDDDYDQDEDMDLDVELGPEDGVFPDHRDAMTEGGPSEYPQSEMFMDPSPEDEAQQIEEYRAGRKNEAKEDLEFPDEIELNPNVLARERLSRFRGLKSLKNSKWETDEDRPHEPEDWRRLLHIADYKGSRNQCIREALAGGVSPGTRVSVHLDNVPLSLKSRHPAPLSLFSLLRHEHKHTVVNINMTLNSTTEAPLRSKEELLIQYGPRRLIISPIFSASGNTPNNVHKFDRYLHPGRSAIATFIGPISWGALPILVFKNTQPTHDEDDPEILDPPATTNTTTTAALQLIGTGTTLAPDHSRVIAKRVILTGHPFKIHKRVVTIRYMFFNAEDVSWFKALQLWTKRGRTGYIKDSLGTHGYFKATFDAKINPQDSIGISLYKRVFPRNAREWEEEA